MRPLRFAPPARLLPLLLLSLLAVACTAQLVQQPSVSVRITQIVARTNVYGEPVTVFVEITNWSPDVTILISDDTGVSCQIINDHCTLNLLPVGQRLITAVVQSLCEFSGLTDQVLYEVAPLQTSIEVVGQSSFGFHRLQHIRFRVRHNSIPALPQPSGEVQCSYGLYHVTEKNVATFVTLSGANYDVCRFPVTTPGSYIVTLVYLGDGIYPAAITRYTFQVDLPVVFSSYSSNFSLPVEASVPFGAAFNFSFSINEVYSSRTPDISPLGPVSVRYGSQQLELCQGVVRDERTDVYGCAGQLDLASGLLGFDRGTIDVVFLGLDGVHQLTSIPAQALSFTPGTVLPALPFSDSFEPPRSDAGNFWYVCRNGGNCIADSFGWTVGRPNGRRINAAASGSNTAWFTSLEGADAGPQLFELHSPTFDLVGVSGAVSFAFDLWSDLRNSADFSVAYTLNGGAEQSVLSGVFEARTAGFETYFATVPGAAGAELRIVVRAALASNDAALFDGVAIDNFQLINGQFSRVAFATTSTQQSSGSVSIVVMSDTTVSGSVSVTVGSSSCSLTLTSANIGSCVLSPLPSPGTYSGSVTYTPSDSHTPSTATTSSFVVLGLQTLTSGADLLDDFEATSGSPTWATYAPLAFYRTSPLVAAASLWQRGTPSTASIYGAASGTTAWATNLAGFAPNVDRAASVISTEFDVTYSSAAYVGFQVWSDMPVECDVTLTLLPGGSTGASYDGLTQRLQSRTYAPSFVRLPSSSGQSVSFRLDYLCTGETPLLWGGFAFDDFQLLLDRVPTAIETTLPPFGVLGQVFTVRVDVLEVLDGVVAPNGTIAISGTGVSASCDAVLFGSATCNVSYATAGATRVAVAFTSGTALHGSARYYIDVDVRASAIVSDLRAPVIDTFEYVESTPDAVRFVANAVPGTWQVGKPTYGVLAGAHSGTSAWSTALTAPPPMAAESTVTSPVYDLRAVVSDIDTIPLYVALFLRTDCADYDGAFLEMAAFAPGVAPLAQAFVPVPGSVSTTYNWYTPIVQDANNPHDLWTGRNPAWFAALGDVPLPAQGGYAQFRVRYSAHTGAAGADGIAFDDWAVASGQVHWTIDASPFLRLTSHAVSVQVSFVARSSVSQLLARLYGYQVYPEGLIELVQDSQVLASAPLHQGQVAFDLTYASVVSLVHPITWRYTADGLHADDAGTLYNMLSFDAARTLPFFEDFESLSDTTRDWWPVTKGSTRGGDWQLVDNATMAASPSHLWRWLSAFVAVGDVNNDDHLLYSPLFDMSGSPNGEVEVTLQLGIGDTDEPLRFSFFCVPDTASLPFSFQTGVLYPRTVGDEPTSSSPYRTFSTGSITTADAFCALELQQTVGEDGTYRYNPELRIDDVAFSYRVSPHLETFDPVFVSSTDDVNRTFSLTFQYAADGDVTVRFTHPSTLEQTSCNVSVSGSTVHTCELTLLGSTPVPPGVHRVVYEFTVLDDTLSYNLTEDRYVVFVPQFASPLEMPYRDKFDSAAPQWQTYYNQHAYAPAPSINTGWRLADTSQLEFRGINLGDDLHVDGLAWINDGESEWLRLVSPALNESEAYPSLKFGFDISTDNQYVEIRSHPSMTLLQATGSSRFVWLSSDDGAWPPFELRVLSRNNVGSISALNEFIITPQNICTVVLLEAFVVGDHGRQWHVVFDVDGDVPVPGTVTVTAQDVVCVSTLDTFQQGDCYMTLQPSNKPVEITVTFESYDNSTFPCTRRKSIVVADVRTLTSAQLPYIDDFEGGEPLPWVADDIWEFGLPTKPGLSGAASGTHAWATLLDSDVKCCAGTVTSPYFNLTGINASQVLFFGAKIRYDLGGYVNLEARYNGDAFMTVGSSGDLLNWYPPSDDAWNGRVVGDGSFVPAVHVLPEAAGNYVQLRFRYSYVNVERTPGFVFDDVAIAPASKVTLSVISHAPNILTAGDLVSVTVRIENENMWLQQYFPLQGVVVVSVGAANTALEGDYCTVSVSALNNYTATCSVSVRTPGLNVVRLQFCGPPYYYADEATLELDVLRRALAVTATAINLDAAPAVVGVSTRIDFLVFQIHPEMPRPAGVVQLTSDDGASCSRRIDEELMGHCRLTYRTPGIRTLTVAYLGDDVYAPFVHVVQHRVMAYVALGFDDFPYVDNFDSDDATINALSWHVDYRSVWYNEERVCFSRAWTRGTPALRAIHGASSPPNAWYTAFNEPEQSKLAAACSSAPTYVYSPAFNLTALYDNTAVLLSLRQWASTAECRGARVEFNTNAEQPNWRLLGEQTPGGVQWYNTVCRSQMWGGFAADGYATSLHDLPLAGGAPFTQLRMAYVQLQRYEETDAVYPDDGFSFDDVSLQLSAPALVSVDLLRTPLYAGANVTVLARATNVLGGGVSGTLRITLSSGATCDGAADAGELRCKFTFPGYGVLATAAFTPNAVNETVALAAVSAALEIPVRSTVTLTPEPYFETFDGAPAFGSFYTTPGSLWQRGASSFFGVASGTTAWYIAADPFDAQPRTESVLYTPKFVLNSTIVYVSYQLKMQVQQSDMFQLQVRASDLHSWVTLRSSEPHNDRTEPLMWATVHVELDTSLFGSAEVVQFRFVYRPDEGGLQASQGIAIDSFAIHQQFPLHVFYSIPRSYATVGESINVGVYLVERIVGSAFTAPGGIINGTLNVYAGTSQTLLCATHITERNSDFSYPRGRASCAVTFAQAEQLQLRVEFSSFHDEYLSGYAAFTKALVVASTPVGLSTATSTVFDTLESGAAGWFGDHSGVWQLTQPSSPPLPLEAYSPTHVWQLQLYDAGRTGDAQSEAFPVLYTPQLDFTALADDVPLFVAMRVWFNMEYNDCVELQYLVDDGVQTDFVSLSTSLMPWSTWCGVSHADYFSGGGGIGSGNRFSRPQWLPMVNRLPDSMRGHRVLLRFQHLPSGRYQRRYSEVGSGFYLDDFQAGARVAFPTVVHLDDVNPLFPAVATLNKRRMTEAPAPSHYWASVVNLASPLLDPPPLFDGTVTLTSNLDGQLCSVPANVYSGAMQCDGSFRSVGTHTITTTFVSSDGWHDASSSSTKVIVAAAAQDPSVSSVFAEITSVVPQISIVGQSVRFAVDVYESRSGVPQLSGVVYLTDAADATVSCSAAVVAGSAACSLVFTEAGVRSVDITFAPNASVPASAGVVVLRARFLVVGVEPRAVFVYPEPSLVNVSVLFRLEVALTNDPSDIQQALLPPVDGVPLSLLLGTATSGLAVVSSQREPRSACKAAVHNGVGRCTVADGFRLDGWHTIDIEYYIGNTLLPPVVAHVRHLVQSQLATYVNVTLDPPAIVPGDSTLLNAVVRVNDGTLPRGNVTVSLGGQLVCQLVGTAGALTYDEYFGYAACRLPVLTRNGTYTAVASYANPASSDAINVTVLPPIVSITAGASPSVVSEADLGITVVGLLSTNTKIGLSGFLLVTDSLTNARCQPERPNAVPYNFTCFLPTKKPGVHHITVRYADDDLNGPASYTFNVTVTALPPPPPVDRNNPCDAHGLFWTGRPEQPENGPTVSQALTLPTAQLVTVSNANLQLLLFDDRVADNERLREIIVKALHMDSTCHVGIDRTDASTFELVLTLDTGRDGEQLAKELQRLVMQGDASLSQSVLSGATIALQHTISPPPPPSPPGPQPPAPQPPAPTPVPLPTFSSSSTSSGSSLRPLWLGLVTFAAAVLFV